MAIRTRLGRREEGQALVELSLCAGFLCLMLLAVWQVGTVFSNFIDVSEAARSGARAAALSGAPTTSGDTPSLTTAKAEGLFAAVNSANLDATKLEVTIEADPSSTWVAGGKVRAIVKYPYSLSLFGVSISSGKLSVTDVMRIHKQGS
jgi:Flp pilus assembly protein TadG